MAYDFSKFHEAQDDSDSYKWALAEMKAGHKQTHWIWYVFPQLAQLGRSRTAVYYGIKDLDEAKAYLADEVLRARLIEITQAALDAPGTDARYLMGSRTDERKLQSCMTLFHLAEPTCELFTKVLEKYFGGELDAATVNFCNGEQANG